MLTFRFSGTEGKMTEKEILTAGMAGREVKLEFTEDWEGLSKIVVFSNGVITRDVVYTGGNVVIPREILKKPLKKLTVGVYGVSPGGGVVIPTLRAQGPLILPGADPAGDPALDPALPIWAQIQGLIGDLRELDTEDKRSLVNAINEAAKTGSGGGGGDALIVTVENNVASHSPAEILAALRGKTGTAVMTDGNHVYYLGNLDESIAVFRLNFIEDGVACALVAKVAEDKTITTELMHHKNPDIQAAVRSAVAAELASVKAFGAAGDGTADDTAAFRAALAANRVVYVPGGTYKLSGGINVRANCELRLDRDAVLDFTQTEGNCISLDMSAGIRGNHATVRLPYAFDGNVIQVSSAESGAQDAVPPFTKWDPMWKTGRYLTDLNIVKPDSRGFHYSLDGTCTGTAVYVSADGSADSSYIWGLNFSGLRIAGGFRYGIRGVNVSDGWAHEMRMEAFIDACEIGVSLEDCSNAYISAIVQPRRAYTAAGEYIPYAKHGIQLIRSTNTDLSGSRVWDWNAANTLWTPGGEYQHISMVGQCRGTILNDFLYYEQASTDIRDLIHTDTPVNLEQMTILQEPITRWFKPADGAPYFFNGDTEKKLALMEDLEGHFQTDRVTAFTDVLATAIDKDGAVLNGIGYMKYGIWDTSGNLQADSYHGCTGLIPCKQGDILYAEGLSFENGDDTDRILFFDESFNMIVHVNRGALLGGSYYASYEAMENGFSVTLLDGLNNAAYAAFNFRSIDIGSAPVMAVNQQIRYSYEGFLADGIKVKSENVVGLEAGSGIAVTGAAVGQTVKIAAVDDNGVPTAWEPVDFPSGGSKEWKVLEGTYTHEVGAAGALPLAPSLSFAEEWDEALIECSITATTEWNVRIDPNTLRSASAGEHSLSAAAKVFRWYYKRIAGCSYALITKYTPTAGQGIQYEMNNGTSFDGITFIVHWATVPEGCTVNSSGKIYYR